ncbi:hypothetical protein J23TS9_18520 [Paenibacillus sp. J23TS9]|uniref:helix-turn-helix domain-containing protein n=1 Tax=Paenibacillus sp. J23TS9 TaxID=2807193 RepID=UPI001B23C3C0|nr:AraC family transcriptional regulator [Paenibacillus sp. J23TS9]GIP26722.1 hypothetical protein J23TS9_18520 [Paenibacillus sp. J23TS9]
MRIEMILPQLEIHKISNSFENVTHAHEDQYQMTIPIQGTCHFTYENKQLALPPGDGLILHPQDRHSFHIGSGDSVMIIRIKDQSLYPKTATKWRELGLRQPFDQAKVNDNVQKWTAEMLGLGQIDTMAVEEMEYRILLELQEWIWGASNRLPILPVNAVSDPHYSRVLDYIHAHFTEQMNIGTLATMAMQSRFHFIRSFKSITGLTPYQYVLHLRVEEAMKQLKRSVMTVTEISFLLGFSSTSQFFRVFSKSVGMTPEQFRKEKR